MIANFDVALGRDHTLNAKKDGQVVIHYDLNRQRRLVSVVPAVEGSGGSKERQESLIATTMQSKKAIKERLKTMVNVEEYLKMDPVGRYKHVMEQVNKLTKIMKCEEAQMVEKFKSVVGLRKFNLVDLTMI